MSASLKFEQRRQLADPVPEVYNRVDGSADIETRRIDFLLTRPTVQRKRKLSTLAAYTAVVAD